MSSPKGFRVESVSAALERGVAPSEESLMQTQVCLHKQARERAFLLLKNRYILSYNTASFATGVDAWCACTMHLFDRQGFARHKKREAKRLPFFIRRFKA